MTMIESVLASVTGAILLAVLGYFLKHQIIPIARNVLNRQLDLSGTWYCSFVTPAGNPHQLTLKLKQRWCDLGGRILVIKHIKATGARETMTYIVRGEARERLVVLLARNIMRQSIGVHIALLEAKGGGVMQGLGLWYSATNKVIQSMEFEWCRTSFD